MGGNPEEKSLGNAFSLCSSGARDISQWSNIRAAKPRRNYAVTNDDFWGAKIEIRILIQSLNAGAPSITQTGVLTAAAPGSAKHQHRLRENGKREPGLFRWLPTRWIGAGTLRANGVWSSVSPELAVVVLENPTRTRSATGPGRRAFLRCLAMVRCCRRSSVAVTSCVQFTQIAQLARSPRRDRDGTETSFD